MSELDLEDIIEILYTKFSDNLNDVVIQYNTVDWNMISKERDKNNSYLTVSYLTLKEALDIISDELCLANSYTYYGIIDLRLYMRFYNDNESLFNLEQSTIKRVLFENNILIDDFDSLIKVDTSSYIQVTKEYYDEDTIEPILHLYNLYSDYQSKMDVLNTHPYKLKIVVRNKNLGGN